MVGQVFEGKVIRSLLGEGESVTASFSFNRTWCELYFKLSGDQNADLHSHQGCGIIQGTALLTALSKPFSDHMPGYGLVGFKGFYPKVPVYIGDTITISLTRLDGKTRLTKVAVRIFRGDTQIARSVVLLILKKYLLVKQHA